MSTSKELVDIINKIGANPNVTPPRVGMGTRSRMNYQTGQREMVDVADFAGSRANLEGSRAASII